MQPDPYDRRRPMSGERSERSPATAARSRLAKRRTMAALLAVPVVAAGIGFVAATPVAHTDHTQATSPSTADADVPGAAAETADLVTRVLAASRTLDGAGNNLEDPKVGQAGQVYPRVAAANYSDGLGEMVDGPAERYLSNRIFNDTNQNIFSENGITHWGFVWGQFLDHTIGLRQVGDEELNIDFDPDDPLEDFTNDLGNIATTRSAVAGGTGVDSPREQVNLVSSYIDAWGVYGGSEARLDWLRDGPIDGDPTNNEAALINEDGYLPTGATRPGAETPETDLMGRLFADPEAAVVAGDVRVNENIGLTAVHTLFLRDHNRIVAALPDDLDEEAKFQIARRVVGAQLQYITYNEFLPTMGVQLDDYQGYDPSVDPSITNEFATVGYRAHSQIHGEFEAEIPLVDLDNGSREAMEARGIEIEIDEDEAVAEVVIPLNVAFGNPGLLREVGLGNMLAGLSSEAAYANDGQIDNQLRSVLFQIPGPDTSNPLDCLDGEDIADCFSGVNDLGALDVARGYDHGMPRYNDMRAAYGLRPVTSFAELTGESTDELGGFSIDDPSMLEVVHLEDAAGTVLEIGSDAAATDSVVAERRTTAAARLAAVFGEVDNVDAFTGMVSEPHAPGTEFGELQLAMWETQFAASRDGDRFFYATDPVLDEIAVAFGVDYRRTLAEVIADNTEMTRSDLPENVFLLVDALVSDGTGANGTDQEPVVPETPTASRANPHDMEGREGRRSAISPRNRPGTARPGTRPLANG